MFEIKTMNSISPMGLEVLEKRGCRVGPDIEKPQAMLIRSAELHDYPFNEELLCIARAGAGYNNIPVEDCAEKGIVVFNSPGANAEAVKELEMCSLVLASREVLGSIEWVKSIAGEGEKIPGLVEKGKNAFGGPELMGKTMGVIGLGATGALVANLAVSLEMTVYGHDPFMSVDAAWNLSRDVLRAESLDELLEKSDYISLNVPYTEETHHMIDASVLARMKDGVRIINESRGEVVCDEDMLAAIESGKVARYVTDFPNEKLIGKKNVIAMPHRERGPLRGHGREPDLGLSSQRQHQKLRQPAQRLAQPHGRVQALRHPPQRPAHDHAHPRFHQRARDQRRAHDQQAARRLRRHDRRPRHAGRRRRRRQHPRDARGAARARDLTTEDDTKGRVPSAFFKRKKKISQRRKHVLSRLAHSGHPRA